MSDLSFLETWYSANCDGDWEHSNGIRITTLDNPGWLVEIDLTDTELTNKEFHSIKYERQLADWLIADRAGESIRIACGPKNLSEAIKIFTDWAR